MVAQRDRAHAHHATVAIREIVSRLRDNKGSIRANEVGETLSDCRAASNRCFGLTLLILSEGVVVTKTIIHEEALEQVQHVRLIVH